MSDQHKTLNAVFSAILQATFRSNCLLSLLILGMIAGISFYLKIEHKDLVFLYYLIIGCVEFNILLSFISEIKHPQEQD